MTSPRYGGWRKELDIEHPTPVSLDALTRLWDCVGGPPDTLEPMSTDRGMSAELWRARWSDQTAVVKRSRQRARGATELRFLSDAPSHPHLPRLLGHLADAERVVLLLEDLSDHTPGDFVVGMTPDQARAAFQALGRIHALNWGCPPSGWTRQPVRFRAFDPAQLDAFVTRYPAADGLLDELDEVETRAGPVLDALPVTLAHADAHLDNWMFGEVPVLIDWETARVSAGVLDVTRLLMEGLRVDVRRALQEELVAIWASEVGVDDPWPGVHAALWWSMRAMLPHHATVDFEALSPRMRQVHTRAVEQALAFVGDL